MDHKLLTQSVQSKFNYYLKKYKNDFSKPECRFIQEVILGILKSQSVILNQIAIHINDKISIKKTVERFSRHLSKLDFWKKLLSNHIKYVSNQVNDNGFALLDLSDIQKKYSTKMEGLEKVKDGNHKDKIGLGYWLMNILYIDSNGDKIIPLYNKLYSFAKDTLSENKEILSGIFTVEDKINKSLTWVIDRGGDRSQILWPLLKKGMNFIIRSTGVRHMLHQGRSLAVKKIGRKTTLKYNFTIQKKGRKRIVTVRYSGGAKRVKYINQDTKKTFHKNLWLVVLKGEGRGYSWYIVSSNKQSQYEVISEVLSGYGYRWKIEEYHRHIKTQFNLEDIQLQKFEALQSMISLLTIAMGLIYSQLKSLHLKMLKDSPIRILQKNKICELMGFIYYKIGTVIKILLSSVEARSFIPNFSVAKSNKDQLALNIF